MECTLKFNVLSSLSYIIIEVKLYLFEMIVHACSCYDYNIYLAHVQRHKAEWYEYNYHVQTLHVRAFDTSLNGSM